MPSHYVESAVNPVLLALTDKPLWICDIAIVCGLDESLVSVTLEYLARECSVPLVIEGERGWVNPNDYAGFLKSRDRLVKESNRRLAES